MQAEYRGFVRAAAASFDARPADCAGNAERLLTVIRAAQQAGAKLLCLPELCLTGYTCGDLFWQDKLIKKAAEALSAAARESASLDVLTVLGLPLRLGGSLYNTAAVLYGGRVLGFVPKEKPARGLCEEARWFAPAPPENGSVRFGGEAVPFGKKLLFRCEAEPGLTLAVELGSDARLPCPPAAACAMAGAAVILHPYAEAGSLGGTARRREHRAALSARLHCGFVSAGAAEGESSTDAVYPGHCLLCENGELLAETPPFAKTMAFSEIDLRALAYDRERSGAFQQNGGFTVIPFAMETGCSSLSRKFSPTPFIPEESGEDAAFCEEALELQGRGLAKRLEHTGCQRVVLGISGGLDSALALLVSVRAMERLGYPLSGIMAVTMPCFGTTGQSRENALRLCAALGIACRTIDIHAATEQHLADIGQPEGVFDTTFENAQARVRTLTLMDLAGRQGGLVVGTGDMSELALGWATYNGDHMSMYAVNAGVPKSLVRRLIRYVADKEDNPPLTAVLADILAAPVSPELLPPREGETTQHTEALLGPYELHDFFLWHFLRHGRAPEEIYALARAVFAGRYDDTELRRVLRVFFSRFFSQQFKRSCMPDGPAVCGISLSPRGGLRMPSDAVSGAWTKSTDIEK